MVVSKNIILNGILDNFSSRHKFSDNSPDIQFEKFVNYCLLKTDYYDSFEFDKVGTGKCIGVDGAAIAINGVLVYDLENVEYFIRGNFDASFYFTQAKTSLNFDMGDFLKFISTVKLFFDAADEQTIPVELKNTYAIKKLIYERKRNLHQLPTLDLSYAFFGDFDMETTNLKAQIENEIKNLKTTNMLSDVKCNIYGGDKIVKLYRESQNDSRKALIFEGQTALPAIKGAQAAYIGVVKCEDYIKFITKDNGALNRGLFVENVRDFLGMSKDINKEIEQSVRSEDWRSKFALLNNGITVVARKVTPSGNNFHIERFQVVNGCQTSHILFNNESEITPDMYITVKLIETSDINLSAKITETANRQTIITKEAFATIRPYHRNLEDFFNAMRNYEYPYYYERRPHQFDDQQDNIDPAFIVTTPQLIKSFVSIVDEEPHKIHYYYGRLVSEYNSGESKELFSDEDHPGLYFAAYHISSQVARYVPNTNPIYKWRFHLSLLIKKQIASGLKRSGKLKDEKFLEILDSINENFNKALKVAEKTLKRLHLVDEEIRTPKATEKILKELQKRQLTFVNSGNYSSTSRSRKPPQLVDKKDYIATVESVDLASNCLSIKHGLFTFSKVEIGPNLKIDSLVKGQRVCFSTSESGSIMTLVSIVT